MRKRTFAAALVLVTLGVFPLCAQQSPAPVGADPAGVILNHFAAGSFSAGPIPKADLDRILQAGIRAPSARNRQPWHFTVVQKLDLAKKIVPQTVDGNVLIVVSAKGDGKTNGSEILDCALAVESMYLAAQVMGYGSRIYTGPVDNLNRSLKKDLDLPGSYSAVVLLRVGRIASPADAVSAPSSRRAASSLVTYK